MKKLIKAISLILSTVTLFSYVSCKGALDPELPDTTETPGTSNTPENKPIVVPVEIGFPSYEDTDEEEYSEVEVIKKDDGTLVETRTTTYKDGYTKVAVLESDIYANKTLKETYSTGEYVETTINQFGEYEYHFYKDGEEITLEEKTLLYNPYNDYGSYEGKLQLSDYINPDDILIGDVIHLTMYGYTIDNNKELGYLFIPDGFTADENWWYPLSDLYKIKTSKLNSFVIHKDIPITNSSTRDLSRLLFFLQTPLSYNETKDNNNEELKILCSIKMEHDTTNRAKPVTLTFDANGGYVENPTETVYTGKYIKTVPTLKNKLSEWTDSEGNTIWKAPEKDMTLKAKWYDKVDLLQYNQEAYVWTDYIFDFSRLKRYPDAIVNIAYTNDHISDDKKCGELILHDPHWTVIDIPNTDEDYSIFKISVKDLIKLDPDSQIIIIDGFDETKGFHLKEFYLDNVKTTITFDLAGGRMDVTQLSLPVGTPIKEIPLKDRVFFAGWVDVNNNPVTVAPEEDCTLYATWVDKLDLIPNPWEDSHYQIKSDILHKYSDAVVVFDFSHEEIDEEIYGWTYGEFAISGPTSGWNELCLFNQNENNHIVIKYMVSDLLEKFPDLEYVHLYGFKSNQGFTINGFYLDYKITTINFELNGGTMNSTTKTMPAGIPLKEIPVKDGALFAGWVDVNNNPVTVAPEEDCTLYATWGDKLDLTKHNMNNVFDDSYRIKNDILYMHPDTAIVLDITHEALDSGISCSYTPLFIQSESFGYVGDIFNYTYMCGPEDHVIFKYLVSDIIKEYSSFDYIILNTSESITINGFYLENPTTINFELNGGTMNSTTKTFPVGMPIEIEEIPLKYGALFAGWVDVNNNPVTVAPEEDCTLYATWGDTLNIQQLLIQNTYGKEIIKLETLKRLKETNVSLGIKITPLISISEYSSVYISNGYYAIIYYYDPESKSSEIYDFDDFIRCNENYNCEDVIFSYSGTEIELCVVYNDSNINFLPVFELNGGWTPASTKAIKKDSLFYFDKYLDEYHIYTNDSEGNWNSQYCNAYKDGYTFDGWYLDENLTVPAPTSPETALTAERGLKFYAKWIEN